MSDRVTILRAKDLDCLQGQPWGRQRCKAAIDAFNKALGLERPQYVLDYKDGEVQAPANDLEPELNRSFQLGISAGLERAAKLLLEEASCRFRQEFDQEAKLLRNLSKQLVEQGKKEHPGVPE